MTAAIFTEHDINTTVAAVHDGLIVKLPNFSKLLVPLQLCHVNVKFCEDVLEVCAIRYREGIAMLRADGILEWMPFKHGL